MASTHNSAHGTEFGTTIERRQLSNAAGSHRYSGINAAPGANVNLGDTYHSHTYHAMVQTEDQKQGDLRKALAYEGMHARRIQLEDKIATSFEWIWTLLEHDESATGFAVWLGSEEQFFWINGKPGSGKSTLVNYITNDPRCKTMLESTSLPGVLLSFYFDFRGGSQLTNSAIGFARSLLHQLVTWMVKSRQHNSSELLQQLQKADVNALSAVKLVEHTQRLIKDVSGTVKICLFIDGLDEYEGAWTTLWRHICDVVRGSHTKVCLCSRPEVAITATLTHVPRFELQQYIATTMHSFVSGELTSIMDYEWFEQDSIDLTNRIVEAANGVFLWATLVCVDLQEGMLAFETFEELLTRLDYFPANGDLSGVYNRMLNGLDERTRFEVAVVLKLLVDYSVVHRQIPNLGSRSTLSLRQLMLAMLHLGRQGYINFPSATKLTLHGFRARLQARLRGLIDLPACGYGG
ncbi:hypothetical protein LTR66_013950, partial [Elasticomyces elasticus]